MKGAQSRQAPDDPTASPLILWFERHAVPVMRRLGELPFLVGVREALPSSFVALVIAFAAILVAGFMQHAFAGSTLGLAVAGALLPAFGVMAMVLAIALPLRLARTCGYVRLPLIVASAGSFFLALPRPFGPSAMTYLHALGATGLFLAILACGTVAAAIALFRRIAGLRAGDWLGAAFALAVFAALLFAHVSLAAGIAAAMQPISRLGDTYAALLAIVLAQTLLWTAGVHGPAMLATVVTPVYLTMQMQNTHAYATHAPLPYIVVVSLFLFVFPGGAGATLPLAALLAFSRVPRLRRVGRITLLPALFNINDPLIFGAPVVFNPYLVVPFIGVPLVLASLTYAAVAAGFVSRPAFYVPSAVPTFVSTYLATQDVRAIGLAALNIALAAVMYYPFVRAYERHAAAA